MKTLYLLRHALALPAGSQSDKERKLSPQGEMDARALGHVMVKKNYSPSYVLCSSATRTQQTIACVLEGLGKTKTDFLSVFYDGSTGDILSEIQKVDSACGSLLIVAHNPGIHELAAKLTGFGSQALLARLSSGGYRPCTLAVLSCPVNSWVDIQPHENELVDYIEPSSGE